MEEMPSPPSTTDDRLFLERFEAFMERSVADMRVFAEREHRPFQEVSPDADDHSIPQLL